MPKDRRSSSCRCRASPYPHSYNNADKRTPKSPSPPIKNENEFEEARCPICMEHPHNAVLLLCSSHEKGCRPYMCNTSPRHSNCLDQFRKSTKLACPLCRGQINGWTVINPAREFMNSKTRNCSLGTCDFTGNYSQLRQHARREHPCVRPTDVDPERELQWRNLQQDMEQQDMFNMQFEFDDNDNDDNDDDDAAAAAEFWASPIWDFDLDFMSFVSTFDFDSEDPLFWDDWDNVFSFSSSHESEIRESSRSRDAQTRSLGRSRENAQTTRSRTSTRVRQRSNSQPSSRNRR